MKAKEARQLGREIKSQLDAENIEAAYSLIETILLKKTPFRILDLVAEEIAKGENPNLSEFLEKVASEAYIGSWTIIGGILGNNLAEDLFGSLNQAKEYIIRADVWHACDTIGERVLGPAMVSHFPATLELLRTWRKDPNPWPRRALGVGVHVWAKRSRGEATLTERASKLLDFLQPLFIEASMDAVKGVAWGLKSLGRYYPELLSEWLLIQVPKGGYRRTMLTKAITYFPEKSKRKILKLANQ